MTQALIVNADDLGLTAGVNEAIERAHQDGIVTATSLLAVGTAFDDAVAMLKRNPDLDAGAHLALVGEDPPLSPPQDVPSLVDRDGAFPLSYRTVVARGVTGRLRARDIRREFTAQLERIARAGIEISHLDTHQHTHLWPVVGRVVRDLARERDIPFIRVPRSRAGGITGLGVNILARRLRRQLRSDEVLATSTYAGLDEAGHLDETRLLQVLRTFIAEAGALGEVNAHPGLDTDPDRARFQWGYCWGAERAALTSPAVQGFIAEAGIVLTSFRKLAAW